MDLQTYNPRPPRLNARSKHNTSKMPIAPDQPQVRRTNHRRNISHASISTILFSALPSSSPPSPRPSTASSQASFQSAFSSLEYAPFRYYLPHISTSTSEVYTKNGAFACNASLSPSSSERSGGTCDRVGRFWQYIPGQSTEAEDVYTDGVAKKSVDDIGGRSRAQLVIPVKSEQKVLGSWNDFVFEDPPTPVRVKSPLEVIGPDDFPYRPVVQIDAHIDGEGVGSHAAGDVLMPGEVVGEKDRGAETMKQRNKLKKKHQKTKPVVGVSEKVKSMLRKLHLGKMEK